MLLFDCKEMKCVIYLELIDLKTLKTFKKEFQTEFERDKFARKLRYSKKLKVIGGNNNDSFK